MRYALFPVLAVLCLVGCASHEPQDFDGTWINQQAIEAAAKGDSLRQALASHGPVFEWQVDTAHRQARYGNGFEVVQGRLENVDGDHWQATFDDARSAQLSLDGKTLVQAPGTSSQALEFERAASAASD